jgi:hypothetical protein
MDGNIELNKAIIELMTVYLNKYPSQRFGQMLFNLDINQFSDKNCPENASYLLRDIYNDEDDDILKRVEERLKSIK